VSRCRFIVSVAEDWGEDTLSRPLEEIWSKEDACAHNESLGKATTKNQVAEARAGQVPTV